MLIYGQLAVVIIVYYFKTENYWNKFFLGVLLALNCGAYVLVFYPAWQVPFAYVFAGLAVWVMVKNRKQINWKKRQVDN